MQIDIPVIDKEIDTSDPLDSGKAILSGVLGVGALMGIVAGARVVVNRASQAAGVDQPQLPGGI